MASFSKIPCEIKENIFSRIRIRDLYEALVVSQKWWWLTLRTHKGILSEDDQLIKTLLDFHNREKRLTPLTWFKLLKYGNFRGVKLQNIPGSLVMKTFFESGQQIRSLCLRTNFGPLANLAGSENLLTKLDFMLKHFPHLSNLSLHSSSVDIISFLKIPKRIQEVHLTGIVVHGVAWSSLFEDPDSVQSLELNVTGLTYEPCAFKNLRSLSLHFEEPLAVDQMKSILDLIRGHKLLKSVKIVGAKITKEWFNLFGQTIENISLKDIDIEKQVLTELGNDGCFERAVMSFVCSDFRTLERFRLAEVYTDIYEAVNEDEDETPLDYKAVYTCKPQLMNEKLILDLEPSFSRQVQTITTVPGAWPSLRDLHIECYWLSADLTSCVPASVQKFSMGLKYEFENISISQLCEQPQNLEELKIAPLREARFSIVLESLLLLTNLKVLHLAYINRDELQNILQHCVSLQKLSLERPERGCFTDLSSTCVNKTIRKVEDVLHHEMLDLSSHLIRPHSMLSAIAKLKLFSVMFGEISEVLDYNSNLVSVMDTVEVPYKLFFSDLHMSSFTLKLGWKDSIIDGLYTKKGFAYCSGIPTRFLEAQGINTLDDVNQFIDLLS